MEQLFDPKGRELLKFNSLIFKRTKVSLNLRDRVLLNNHVFSILIKFTLNYENLSNFKITLFSLKKF